MSDAPPVNIAPQQPPPPPSEERVPFWGYSDLLLVAGLAIPCMLLGWVIVRLLYSAFGFRPPIRVLELLPQQLLGYAFLFGVMAVVLRLQYERPFWRSLGWRPVRLPAAWIVLCGMATAVGVAVVGYLIRTPMKSNPMTELLQDRTSVILMAAFGTTIGPLAEELVFRGFLQPLLVRSLGGVAGILLAALPFGLLHFHEYGNSWQHVVLITLAGASFGWMRHATGSTRAATIMHAAYNGLIFVSVFASQVRPAS
jgi:membrane protease YdiL (CAAX protease family)